jgi:hypothetical protein
MIVIFAILASSSFMGFAPCSRVRDSWRLTSVTRWSRHQRESPTGNAEEPGPNRKRDGRRDRSGATMAASAHSSITDCRCHRGVDRVTLHDVRSKSSLDRNRAPVLAISDDRGLGCGTVSLSGLSTAPVTKASPFYSSARICHAELRRSRVCSRRWKNLGEI